MRGKVKSVPNPLAKRTTVFIVGGSSGIGLACAQMFASNGNDVAIFARDFSRLDTAVQDLRAVHPKVSFASFTMDVCKPQEVARAFESAAKELGSPGILICSAGDTLPGYWESIDDKSHTELMDLNYFGSVNCVHAVRPHLLEGASIVLVSSAVALHGVAGYSAYAPSKFAVRGLAEVLRPELIAQNIFVTVALPPDTTTPQLERERLLRPSSTQRFSELTRELPAEKVAANIYNAVKARRFLALPTISLWLLYLFGGFTAPFLRAYQTGLIRREKNQ